MGDSSCNGDLQFSDKTAVELFTSESTVDGDAVDLAVNSTDMLGPFIDGLLPMNTDSQENYVECTNWMTDSELPNPVRHADVEEAEFVYDGLSREGMVSSEAEDETVVRNLPSCSRSSTFSERSVESCDSFVSAASRLEPYAEREELHKMFNMFDENGDGRISSEELGNTMRKLGYEITLSELEGMVVAVDNDGDGYVDFDEFLALYSTLYYEGDEHKARLDVLEDEHELEEAFAVFDKNNDGYISVVELQAVLSSLGLKEGTKLVDCQKMIKAVDSDGDGQVNFEEFKNMMTSALFNKQ